MTLSADRSSGSRRSILEASAGSEGASVNKRVQKVTPDLYISGDVETDGPIPGPFSMLSFGFSALGTYDGSELDEWPTRSATFSASSAPSPTSTKPRRWPSTVLIANFSPLTGQTLRRL